VFCSLPLEVWLEVRVRTRVGIQGGLAAALAVSIALSLLNGSVAMNASGGFSGRLPGGPIAATDLGSVSPGYTITNNATITIRPSTQTENSSFWGVSLDGTKDPGTKYVAALLNETPFTTLRYGSNWADQTNWSSGCQYNGSIDPTTDTYCWPASNTVVDFATLCQWLAEDRCYLAVPAEINSIQVLRSEVGWLHNTTHWWPTCWAIGNEPALWTHFNEPWTSWRSTDDSVPTPLEFAKLVENYSKVLGQVDPGACIVGIESSGDFSNVNIDSWIQNTTELNPNITEVAFHDYPGQHCVGANAPPLSAENVTSIQRNYTSVTKAINRSGIRVDVQEFSIGVSTPDIQYGQPACRYVGQPPNAVFDSAVTAQALAAGDPQLVVFHFDCTGASCLTDNGTRLSTTSVFYVYSYVLSHMEISRIYNVTSSGATVGTYMVLGASADGLNQSLLVSNANQSEGETVNVTPAIPPGWSAVAYCQGPGPEANLSTTQVPADGLITMGNQSTCVIRASSPCSTSGCAVYAVAFQETGLPTGASWRVDLNGGGPATTSNLTSILFQLANGSYTFAVSDILGYDPSPASGSIVVTGRGAVENVTFTVVAPTLYSVTFVETGLDRGSEWSVTLAGSAAQSAASTLTFDMPNGTYGFTVAQVSGYALATPTGLVNVSGEPVSVELNFSLVPIPTFPLVFVEAGLPSSTSWGITLNGKLNTSQTRTIEFEETNGSYGFTVSTVSGFSSNRTTGSVAVTGAPLQVLIGFSLVPPTYSVSFSESGLPLRTSWTITLGSLPTQAVVTTSAQFLEANGTYSFAILSPAGYSASPSSGSISVAGTAASVTVSFVLNLTTPSPGASGSTGPSTPGWVWVAFAFGLVTLVVILALVLRGRIRLAP
jgi:hypothetical protein